MADDNTTENENNEEQPVSQTEPTTTNDENPTESEEEAGIEIVVENGSCVIAANSYVSLEDAIAYNTSRKRTDWLELDPEEQKSSLIKATQYIDNLYTWKGRRKYETQVLAFPRVMIRDLDGFDLSGKIPPRLKDAICEAAFYGSTTDLFTVYESESGNIKRDKKRVEGAVESEVEFFSNSESEVNYISKYSVLDNLLRGLYIPKNFKTVNHFAHWHD